MSAVSFRDAGPIDAPVLADLGRRAFTETFGHLYDPADLALFLATHTEARWRRELSNPGKRVRVAEAAEAFIAYAKLGPPTLPFEPEGRAIELGQFYVLAPWHGTGVARELMAWVLATARDSDADSLYLSVFTDNHRARRFYESYGFRFVQTYAFMVGNHADEDHILRLSLREPE